MTDAALEPPHPLDALESHDRPVIIGVRHHSAALAAVMPDLLDRFEPPVVYLELPPELGEWLEWLGHPDLESPVVLAAARPGRLAFYPFADFSPELAAVRWAVARGVPVVPIDAPVRAELPKGEVHDTRFQSVLDRAGARDLADFWDQEVEARSAGADPEAVRKAALAVGLALRAAGPSPSDVVREHFMREALADAPTGSVAVIGAFHGAGLLDGPAAEPTYSDAPVVTSLVPYTWSLFDLRSGYPAGVRDPALQQAFFEAFRERRPPRAVLADAVVRVARELRRHGHVGGVPDSAEAVRVAVDLASIRGRPDPGRRELMEAIETTMGRGQRLGRGRALARAMNTTLVGSRRGRLARGTPRSGLETHLEALVADLRLPGPEAPEKTLRLDPLRSDLDRRRHIALLRMRLASVDYASEAEVASSLEALGATWTARWTPATSATASLAGMHGVTLAAAAGGTLGQRRRRLERDDALTAGKRLQLVWSAAEAGVLSEAGLELRELWGPEFLGEAGLVELVGALRLIGRVRAGHALGTEPEHAAGAEQNALLRAAVRQVEALGGSKDPDDARAMAELANVLGESGERRALKRALERLAESAGPLIQGAARTLQVALGAPSEPLGIWLESVVRGAVDADARHHLTLRLTGALTVGGPLIEADPLVLGPLTRWVETATDDDFLSRLPSLRGGFDVLSPAARGRFLADLVERYGDLALELEDDPAALAGLAAADLSARTALEARFGPLDTHPSSDSTPEARDAEPGATRWRLILGRQREQLNPSAMRVATALDELYGRGQGEGSREGQGGSEGGFVAAREWAGELESLFGARVRDEVLAKAGEGRRPGALVELDPDDLRPSVELLRQLLSLAGGLGEGRLAKVRTLVQRVVDDLTKALAVRVRPALAGATIPRPTRRRTARLDLPRTIRKNLQHVRHTEAGPVVVPEHLIFRSGSRRSVDWELALVVDVSGSMEPSVLYSAMMAAILSAVPWLGVQFYAFNTEVIDLSERVADPLSLLLEVQVGGGTHIGRALRFTRENLRVPSRSMVVLVSDFEEGAPVHGLLSEVRTLVQSGVRCLGVAALDDAGSARYHASIASQVAAAGMPVAAVSPLELARWVSDVVHG